MERWSNSRRELTANQEVVFRTVFEEELQSGRSPAEALREAERFMNEDALPDWKQFWHDWNAPPGPLENMRSFMFGYMLVGLIAKNADRFSGQMREMADSLKYLVAEKDDAS